MSTHYKVFWMFCCRASESRKKRMLWSDEDMVAAMSAVHDQSLTVTQAAHKYNVPRKTLDDRVKKKVVHGTHPGPSTVLTSKEEDALVW